jgi:hypothetical protein
MNETSQFRLVTDTPENLGIPPERIVCFFEQLEREKLCMHSVLLLRHDTIAAEAHCPPFTGDTLHRMYSTSKTFVSMAIGFLIDQGKIGLDSKIADFFSEYVPQNPHAYIKEMTVQDLLLMATPYSEQSYTVRDDNWIKTFFNRKPNHFGGSAFYYDTSGTVALNALVEKLSGKNLVDFLRPLLLDPLGISKGAWCVERPEGGAWGGSGMMLSSRDLARFGLFLLHKGNWQGRQLISRTYMDKAVSPQIDNRVSTGNPETQFGYGYQIWMTRHKGYATLGMGSQIAVCLPDKDLLLVTTGDTQCISDGTGIILNALWTHIYPYLSEKKLPENKAAVQNPETKLRSLEFPVVDGESSSPLSKEISGCNYLFDENPAGIRNARFLFTDTEAVMAYTNASGAHEIRFGIGKYTEGIFPETHYFGRRIGVPLGKGYRYKASASWFKPDSLVMYLYIIDDYLGTLKLNAVFKGSRVTLSMSKAAEWFLDEYTGVLSGRRE